MHPRFTGALCRRIGRSDTHLAGTGSDPACVNINFVIIFAQLLIALATFPAHFLLVDLNNLTGSGSSVCSLIFLFITLSCHVMPSILRSIANCVDLILPFRAFVVAHVSAA